LLWSGLVGERELVWPQQTLPPELRRFTRSATHVWPHDQLLEIFAIATLTLGLTRGGIEERVRGGRSADAARQVLQMLTGCFGLIGAKRSFVSPRRGEPLVESLLRALGLAITSDSMDSVQGALIILADFELSPGAFAARVAASSGATLHSCIASAMCASSGIRIGRLYAEIEDFLSGAVSRRALLARAAEHQRRGLAVPGFNHPHYPKGDPRATFILERSRRQLRPTKRLATIHAFIDAAAELGLLPRHELALVALCIALDMPARCAGALFTLARTTGWVAHVQEQRLSPTVLRPRAQFVGTQC
jgi:citrate synthase